MIFHRRDVQHGTRVADTDPGGQMADLAEPGQGSAASTARVVFRCALLVIAIRFRLRGR
jgi:hypothetical protein